MEARGYDPQPCRLVLQGIGRVSYTLLRNRRASTQRATSRNISTQSRSTPHSPGTYALILRSAATRRIGIGRLGTLQLRPGYYIYIGSAFGAGGLRARIGHHQGAAKSPHWHIDYLRRHTSLESVLCCPGKGREHTWAGRIGAILGARIALPGFGSSDCDCKSHLYWLEDRSLASTLQRVLGVEGVDGRGINAVDSLIAGAGQIR
jgi:Uri superfamily endonuclease